MKRSILTVAILALFVLTTVQCQKDDTTQSGDTITTSTSWERYMYVDHTDSVYRNAEVRSLFCRYLRKYGFTGVYLYETGGVLADEGNYTELGNFMEQLDAYGVKHRAVASGTSETFLPGGDVANFNASQSKSSRRVNRANLEREWWNGDGT